MSVYDIEPIPTASLEELYRRDSAIENRQYAEQEEADRLRRHFTPGRGDLCELCGNNVVVEGEDFCRGCMDDLEPAA